MKKGKKNESLITKHLNVRWTNGNFPKYQNTLILLRQKLKGVGIKKFSTTHTHFFVDLPFSHFNPDCVGKRCGT